MVFPVTRIFIFLLLFLAACSPRPNILVMPQAAPVGKAVPVFYSTTRAQDPDGSFGTGRSFESSYGQVVVSVPPEHQAGRLELHSLRPDPQKHFLALSQETYKTRAAFRSTLAKAIRQNPSADREVTLFVHGYNNTFGEGLFRQAQLVEDFAIPSTIVNFAWPSAANPLAYAHDSESALFSRDALESLIEDIHAAGARNVILVGHSMGAFLSMEVMRQMELRKRGSVRKHISSVVLISPDLDVDLFLTQAPEADLLPQPFVIFSSKRDRVLQLSARINGDSARLGNLPDAELIADLPITIVDVAEFSQRRDLGHFTIGSSATLINIIRNLPALDQTLRLDLSGRSGLVPGTILTVQNATQIILSPVTP